MKKFGVWIVVMIGILSAGVIGYTYTTNPYSYFHANYDDAYELTGYWRLVKPMWLKEKPYNTFVIGSSRSQSGFNPDTYDKLSDNSLTYNMALPGMGYYEVLETADYITETVDMDSPKTFIVAMDAYLMPMNKAKARNEQVSWTPKRYNAFGKIEYSIDFWAKILFSRAAIEDGYAKVNSTKKPQLKWQKNGFSRVGFNKFRGDKVVRDLKKWRKRKRFILGDQKVYYFRQTMEVLDQPNVTVYFIHLPFHNFVQGIFEELSPGYQTRAKTKLVQAYLDYKPQHATYEMYDYFTCNEYNSEQLNSDTKSQYFRDLSHMRAIYGDQILEEILSDGPYQSNLGVKIETMERYKSFLKKDKSLLDRWISQHTAYYEASDDSEMQAEDASELDDESDGGDDDLEFLEE